jgi:16S rRNA (cytidine1402-2'-O)-methyltransferase
VKGILYIVSTPIGNLEDITLRALRVLKEVDAIAAEDTRHSLKLLNHYNISKPLVSYWGEKEKVKAEETLLMLNSGKTVALITDAGTPGISDPGNILIRKAIEEGIRVIPIPGPTAVIAALSISGFSTDAFIFRGFLPVKVSQRLKELKGLSLDPRTIVLYEAPHRLLETLADIREAFDDRRVVVIKEITKFYEEAFRGTASVILERLESSKIAGEYVIVLEGRPEDKLNTTEDALTEVKTLMKRGLRRKEAVKKIAEEYGISKKELYDKSLSGV